MSLDHPALPPPASRPWIGAACLVWMAAAMVHTPAAPDPYSAGRVDIEVTMLTDPISGPYGTWALAEGEGAVFLLDFDQEGPHLALGDVVRVEGVANGRSGSIRGRAHSSTVAVRRFERISGPTSPVLLTGNRVRAHVISRLRPFTPGRALLAGFLIGDTSGLDEADIDAMRLSGLSHFVAVSGSNVALFLGLLAVAAGPLAWGPNRRAVVGLVALPVFAAATRFEPSVLRACLMAAIALTGRLLGVVLEAWQVISLAVMALVLIEPGLTASAGFHLSVAATCGVVAAARWPIHNGKVGRAVAVACGAQLAVAPVLLLHFGTVPLLSPLVNVIAAPLVAAATVVGAVAVAVLPVLTNGAAALAEVVLALARGASVWPQVGALPVLGILTMAISVIRWPSLRPWMAVAAASTALVVFVLHGPDPPDPGVVVLDVGQGDAILINGGNGRLALVDGGPDAALLMGRLRRYGVTALDLVVMTHVHSDHATGLAALPGVFAIGEVWADPEPHHSEAASAFLAAVTATGINVTAPPVGAVRRLGELQIVALGPRRAYASPNDQSIVLMVRGSTQSMLLAGDIEVIAQRELGGLHADVLKVPHQGAGTSDPAWLAEVGATTAVISVGPNDFGHPSDWVVELLEDSGATVVRTDIVGDVHVPLS